MKGKMKDKMKRDRGDFFLKKCFKTLNPPDELAQHVSKKIPVGTTCSLHFFFESSESDRVSQLFT